MRAQKAYWVSLLVAMLGMAGLVTMPAAADEQSQAQKLLLPAAETAAPLSAAAPAAAPVSGAVEAKPAASSSDKATSADTPATKAVTAPDQAARPAADSLSTGSLPKDEKVPPVVAEPAAAPDQIVNPASAAVPPATVTPTAPATAAPPAGPTLADVLHNAIDVYAAAAVKSHDAAEMRKEHAAIAAFYAARNYAPLWLDNGKPNSAARSAMVRLARAGDDGLSVDGLPGPVFAGGEGDAKPLDAKLLDTKLVTAEIDLTAQVIAYAREASGSRVDPRRIGKLIGVKPDVAEPAQILSSVAAAGANAGTVLENFNPPQAGYRALREKLAELRRETRSVASSTIPRGRTLTVGMSDPRVPLIRSRFGLDTELGAAEGTSLLYDTRVAAAVAEFQKAYGLPASGTLTARTIAALSGGQPSRLENELLANMEFWRWMPRDMGKDRIEVNIPDFSVSVFHDDQLVWRNKVIVGKPQTPTPVFSDKVEYVIVNPYWNVPPSIIRKEMLPHLEQDPTYLSRLGYEVFTRHGHLAVRQPPGARNALGRIKFIFPNNYAVYLHDTPSRGLFGAKRRAFSHGCVRVDQPFGLAEAVLGHANGWSEQRVKRLIGSHEHYINLPKPLPIHLVYFTAFVDADGHLQLRNDIYQYTAKMERALGLEK